MVENRLLSNINNCGRNVRHASQEFDSVNGKAEAQRDPRGLQSTGGNCIGGLVIRVLSNVPAARVETPQEHSQPVNQTKPPREQGLDIR